MSNFPFLLAAAVSYMSVSYWRGLAVVEVLNDQNLFKESKLAKWFLSYVQFVQAVISQNELKLLGSVEKWITLN